VGKNAVKLLFSRNVQGTHAEAPHIILRNTFVKYAP
jgi:hypothetical protein